MHEVREGVARTPDVRRRKRGIRRKRGGYETPYGRMLLGSAEKIFASPLGRQYQGQVQLIFTSPPFPLLRKKKYGNLQGDEYKRWLASFAGAFRKLLKPDGSIVMEIGNPWEPGRPVMSTLTLEALLGFLKEGEFKLCQQFICYNPARLPAPAEWVNVQRVRVKDSYTHVWWMSPTEHPKADNRRVLRDYSASMVKLLKSQVYNSGRRPSEYHIGARSFLKDHNGSIPPNVLTLSNTRSKEAYQLFCRAKELPIHPARMPAGLAEFFIKFLTTPKNLVLDPFAGSNTTGFVAEKLKRRWVSVEPKREYVEGSLGRFFV